MTAYKVGQPIIPLTERNGAPRHADDKLQALIKAAVKSANEESDRTLVKEMRELTQRMEKGFTRLSGSLEAYISGEQEVAVAHMVDGDADDLPSISRLKAESTLVYTLSASDIAEQMGIPVADVSYLISQRLGLDWVRAKPELWNDKLFSKTKRRLWHPKTVDLLREVILDAVHPERATASAGCLKVLERNRDAVK